MSNGNRRYFLAFAGLALASAAYGQDETTAANQPTDQQAEIANPETPTASVEQVVPALRTELERSPGNIITETGKTQAERDLEAQEDMAFWAFVMALAAVATLFVSGYVALLVKKTLQATADAARHAESMAGEAFKATEAATDAAAAAIKSNKIARKAQRDSRKANDATIIAANASVEANEIARETGRKQVRAYIGIGPVTIDDGDDLRFPEVTFQIVNNGTTPADIFHVQEMIFWMGKPSAIVLRYDQEVELRLHANTPSKMPTVFTEDIGVCEGEGFFIATITISYKDAFGDNHVEQAFFRTMGSETLIEMDWPAELNPTPKITDTAAKKADGSKDSQD